MYIYSQQMGDHMQAGLVCLSSVDDYENGKIKRHELTIHKKEADRTQMTYIQRANIGPVFLAFNQHQITLRINKLVQELQPYSVVKSCDDVTHTLWKLDDEDSQWFQEAFGNVEATYIADGHHRAASAYNVGKRMKEEAVASGKQVTGEEDFNFFLTILYPDEHLKIIEYNRVLKSLNGMTPQGFLEKVGESYIVEKVEAGADPKPRAKFECSLYLETGWYRMTAKKELIDLTDPVKSLDVQFLSDHVLTPILEIVNIRTDERIECVGGIRGIKELEKRCGEDCVGAFAMYPVCISELLTISDEGLIMPPKSTWFEPKPRSGFVVNVFE